MRPCQHSTSLLDQLQELPIADATTLIRPTVEEIALASKMVGKFIGLEEQPPKATSEARAHSKAKNQKRMESHQKDILAGVIILRNLLSYGKND